MARPDFLKKWASSRVSIPAISDPDYALGFANYLGSQPPSTDDHDYIMNLQDERAVWLDENKANLDSPAFTGTPTAPTPATGLRSTAIATMQKFADEFGSSLASNGYQRLPSGLIIQWGQGTSLTSGVNTNTFPIAFPNLCFSLSGIAINSTVYSDVFECTGTITNTNFTSAVVSSGAGGSSLQVATQYRWFAIGY